MSTSEEGLRTAAGRVGPADERPLSQEEFQLLQRLLSDPFSFPIQYKTWLVSYLESSDLSLPIGAIQGLTTLLGITAVGGGTLGLFPAGLILPYGGNSPPTGSLMCDGTAYDRVAQRRLFEAIGTNFGAPSGTTFSVPDMQGRIPVGRGPHGDVAALNASENLPASSRSPRHNSTHTLSLSAHQHEIYVHPTTYLTGTPGAGQSSLAGQDLGGASVPNGVFTRDPSTLPRINGAVGPGGARPDDTPAYLTINFIIVN